VRAIYPLAACFARTVALDMTHYFRPLGGLCGRAATETYTRAYNASRFNPLLVRPRCAWRSLSRTRYAPVQVESFASWAVGGESLPRTWRSSNSRTTCSPVEDASSK